MIAAVWSAPLASYAWQVALHSSVMGAIFYLWARQQHLPSGRTKRRLLMLVLVLPLATAAVPGRSGMEFAERLAWLNSARILAIPVGGGVQLYHVAILGAIVATAITFWQEVLQSFHRPPVTSGAVPESLMRLAHSQPGWERCTVRMSPLPSILVATTGWPGRPTLIVSRGALEALSDDELALVILHEHAHWQDGRWWQSHVLFLVRLLQCYHPAALLAFREYTLEVEVDCDAVAVSGRDPHALARILLRLYQAADRRDVAARSALRKRVDVLMAGGPQDAPLPPATIAIASIFMLLVLPWIV